jgi:hypothetical protein
LLNFFGKDKFKSEILKKIKMKKFLGKIARFALRNLILMICLIMLGIWVFPRNNYPISSRSSQSRILSNSMVMMDYAEGNIDSAPMMQKSRGIPMPSPNIAFADVSKDDRKVIKNASLNIEVDDTEITKDLVEEKVAELGGVITNMNSYEVRTGILSYNMTLRIPSGKLDAALENLASLGVKKSENFSSSDITTQYMDTENQIKNLETRRDRLRELMKFKTDNLSDVLQIDRELSSVQNQIENFQRTQNRRDNDVNFSTINLQIQPKPQIGDFSSPQEWNVEKTWTQSVNDLIHSLQNIAKRVIHIVVYAPIWLPILVLLWFIQRYIRRKTNKNPAKK